MRFKAVKPSILLLGKIIRRLDLKCPTLSTTQRSFTHAFPSAHCLSASNTKQLKSSGFLVARLLISAFSTLFSDSLLSVLLDVKKGWLIDMAEQRAALFSDLISAIVLGHAFIEAMGIIH